MSEVSVMGTIEHSVSGCPTCAAPIDGANVWHEADCPRRNDEALTVEVVRADFHRGAVETLEKIAAVATLAADGNEAVAQLARVQGMAEAALARFGGQ